MENKKEVRYDIYCKSCKYEKTDDIEDPCNECLTQPYNYDSHKPVNYEEEK